MSRLQGMLRTGRQTLLRLVSRRNAVVLDAGLADAQPLSRGFAGKSMRTNFRSSRFVDWLRVRALGGAGGAGSTSFWHSRVKHRKGADGGNGGPGGDVILQASSTVRCLSNVLPHLKGRRGARGGKQGSAGARGEDYTVLVPVGTRVWVSAEEEEKLSGLPRGVTADDTFDDDDDEFSDTDASDNEHSVDELYDDSDDEFDDDDDDDFSEEEDDGDEHDRSGKTQPLTLASHPGAAAARKSGLALLADLAVDGATVVAARGGRGGRGNGLLDQDKPGSQRDRAEPGEEGQERRLLLEMCSVADIGLVGPPNVGKSSLLAAMTNARPEVGNYAFTTLTPQLGRLVSARGGGGGADVAADTDAFAATVADIPGLIPGAHDNRGLGHAFLRHVERCPMLVVVVDLSLGTTAGPPGPRPWEQFDSIMEEMLAYDPALVGRVALCAATKLDCPGAKRAFSALRTRLKKRGGGILTCALSSVTGEGVLDFKAVLLEAAGDAKQRREAEAASSGGGGPLGF